MTQKQQEQIAPAFSHTMSLHPHHADTVKTYVVHTVDSAEADIRSEYQFDGEMGGFSPARFEMGKPYPRQKPN